MVNPNVYTWDTAHEGDASAPFTYEVTEERILDYCRAVRYENPAYSNESAAKAMGLPGIIAPPTMCFVYAPLRLDDLASRRRCLLPARATAGQRTPFVSSEVTFLGSLVRPSDTVASTTSLQRKWERGGDKLLTFLVTGRNQEGQQVCEYTYTVLWEPAGGGPKSKGLRQRLTSRTTRSRS